MKTFQKILVLLLLQLLCIPHNAVAQDTIHIVKPAAKHVSKTQVNRVAGADTTVVALKHKKTKFKAEPLKASMMAVVFPGLGQIYNRKIWKIPLVYAGFGGLIYSVKFNSNNYIKYMKAYQDFTDAIPETQSYLALITAPSSTYDPVLNPDTYIPANQAYYKDGMLRMVDYYKRYRDLSYIGIAGWYLMSILDANVDASLFNYDITNSLELSVFPSQIALPGGFMGAGLNVGMTITF